MMKPLCWLVERIDGNSGDLFQIAEPNEKATNSSHWTDAFPVYRSAPEFKELTDEEILEAMRKDLNNADGGYVCDMAPEHVIAAGRALLEKAKL